MNSDDIRKIEQALEIKLPSHYVNYITNIPPSLIELKSQLGELLFLFESISLSLCSL